MFYDLNAIMNQELTFSFVPYTWNHFEELAESDYANIDNIATLMCDMDNNFDELYNIWSNDKKWRMFCSPLVGENDIWNGCHV